MVIQGEGGIEYADKLARQKGGGGMLTLADKGGGGVWEMLTLADKSGRWGLDPLHFGWHTFCTAPNFLAKFSYNLDLDSIDGLSKFSQNRYSIPHRPIMKAASRTSNTVSIKVIWGIERTTNNFGLLFYIFITASLYCWKV